MLLLISIFSQLKNLLITWTQILTEVQWADCTSPIFPLKKGMIEKEHNLPNNFTI